MPQFVKEGEYVTVPEAAKLLGVSEVTVRHHIHKGSLPSVSFGSLYILPLDPVLVRRQQRLAYVHRQAEKLGVADDRT